MKLVSRIGSMKTIFHCVDVIQAVVRIKTSLKNKTTKTSQLQHEKKKKLLLTKKVTNNATITNLPQLLDRKNVSSTALGVDPQKIYNTSQRQKKCQLSP